MKFVYASNIWSHHQSPVSAELHRLLGDDDFRMALFEEVHSERSALGWAGNYASPFVIGPPRDAVGRAALYRACIEADVLVIGECPAEILAARVAENRLTMIAAERMLKKPFHHLRLLNPRYARGFARFRSQVNHPCVHALAIGHYAPDDLRVLGAFGDRIWRWGYFVDVATMLPPRPLSDPIGILWVGRMLDWKRVDTLIRAMPILLKKHDRFVLTLVGDGPERERLLSLAKKLGLGESRVRFAPPVPFAQVRDLMRSSDICVLSSNRHEGWGAVAGEAMSEGCVLVANEQAGAARELVVDGETGMLFRDGQVDSLVDKLAVLGADRQLRMRLRHNAWTQMQLWHPGVAAERLVALCHGIMTGDIPRYASGPCSQKFSN